jgi:hypothetical protein
MRAILKYTKHENLSVFYFWLSSRYPLYA